jgi:hypothetical protein
MTGQPFQKTVTLNIQSISNVSGDIWRYQFSTGADVSTWKHLSEATFSGCTNANNDGTFPIDDVDLDNSRIDVENSSGVAQGSAAGTVDKTIHGHAIHTDSAVSGSITIDALDGFKTAKHTITTTPTVTPATPLVDRRVLLYYNTSNTVDVYLGSSAAHTTADSLRIFPQDTFTFELSDNAANLYLFTSTGTADVIVVEGS